MKKLLIACSMIGAVALVACAAGTDSQSNSVTTNYAHDAWFSASASGETITAVGGNFSVMTDSASSFAAKDGKIEIDGDDVSDPVSFVLDQGTASLTTTLACVSFELDPAVVPYSARPTDLDGVKVAFALCENEAGTATNFCAWVNGVWKKLNFTIPTDTYELTMSFNESDSTAKKVQFSKGTGNDMEVSDWYVYTTGLDKPQIDFVGSGKITQLVAAQLKLVSADVDFNGQSVKIAGDDMDAMNALIQPGGSIETALDLPVKETVTGGAITIDSSCPLTTAEAYAIGLIANEGGEMVAKADGTFKVKADATAAVAGNGIKVGFATPLTANDKTANITYRLKGSQDGTNWSEPFGGPWTNPNDIVIPTVKVTTDGYRYFKVVTTVDLTTKN